MPLIVLGLLVVLGIVIYALIKYGQSDEEPRSMRERFPRVFETAEDFAEKMKKGANYTIIEDEEDESDKDQDPSKGGTGGSSDDGHTMHFPDNAEVEKIKRNIH